MSIITIIALFLLASWGVYLCIPNRGLGGFMAAGLLVGAFLSLVCLTKLVILL